MIIYVQQVEQGGENVKNRLKEERELKGLSQDELSEKSTVSRTTISNLETGKTIITTTATLEKIAAALGKKVREIFFQE